MKTRAGFHGQFRIQLPGRPEIILPNTIPNEGEEALLKMAYQGDNVILPAGNNFYIGLCNQVPTETDTLASITSEPTVTNGYARQPVARSAVGWPTINLVNNVKQIVSQQVTFTAAGGPFSTSFSRAFLCNVASGSSGVLFAYSAALSSPILLQDTESFPMTYEVFAN